MKETETVTVQFQAEFVVIVETFGSNPIKLARVRLAVGHNPESTILVPLEAVTFNAWEEV